VSGPTFACPGEPDLDRIIRLQNPVAPRWPHEHDIGVDVYSVTIDDPSAPNGQRVLPNHPLQGAHVDFLDVCGDERNFVVLYQKMPIVPFRLNVTSLDGQIVLDRVDLFDITRPKLMFDQICQECPELIDRRTIVVVPNSSVVAEATGIVDYAGYRRQRKLDLIELIKKEPDPIKQLALDKRIRNLEKDDEGMEGTTLPARLFLGLCGTYSFGINGPPRPNADPKNLLEGQIGTSQDWPITFWMGGFDVDTMCASSAACGWAASHAWASS